MTKNALYLILKFLSCISGKNYTCYLSRSNFLLLLILSFADFVHSIDETLKNEADFTFATPRYMAPEVANGTLFRSSFEALKMVDMYSLGLVFYEICQ
jgi:serine/threonine protein kinase